MDLGSVIQIWLAALFTVWIYSIAFRDNVFFKFAEHTFVGAAAGHNIVYAVDNIRRYGWTPFTQGATLYLVVFLLGLILYTRYHSKYFWLSRFPLAIMVGIGIGLSMRATVTAEFIAQIISTASLQLVGVDAWTAFSNLIFIIIVVSVVYFFVFTFPGLHGGGRAVIPKIARYGMMAAFGYAFANTVLSRFQMIFGRLDFLMSSWLPLPGAMMVLPIVLILLIYAMIPAEKRPWPKSS
ncbi:hypothetical protein KEJ21_00150 [Candidatus Bathyarchaeota archaeon]|nr:hypothetical protein [Candidatus Bathyarchaeota archaeon]MBS7630180.1 hypothetical protein [Candidatus Bathyarchaeota archaeon]